MSRSSAQGMSSERGALKASQGCHPAILLIVSLFFFSVSLAHVSQAYEIPTDFQKTLLDETGKPVEIVELHREYGFLAVLEGVHFPQTVLRLKGFVREDRCPGPLWRQLSSRADAKILRYVQLNGERQAVVLDCILDLGGSLTVNSYHWGKDGVDDYFLNEIQRIQAQDVPLKAIILSAVEGDWDILLQEASRNQEFEGMLRELKL